MPQPGWEFLHTAGNHFDAVTQDGRAASRGAPTAPQGDATRTEVDERSALGAARESDASATPARQPVRGNPGRKPGDTSSAVRVGDASRTGRDKRRAPGAAQEGDASVVPAHQPGRGKPGSAARRKRQRNANKAAARAPGTHQGEVAAPQRGRKQGRARTATRAGEQSGGAPYMSRSGRVTKRRRPPGEEGN